LSSARGICPHYVWNDRQLCGAKSHWFDGQYVKGITPEVPCDHLHNAEECSLCMHAIKELIAKEKVVNVGM
jgi:hypothetical protein